MTAAVGIWSLASAAHAWATGFWSFGIARAVLGAGEGATFPGGLRTVTQTLSACQARPRSGDRLQRRIAGRDDHAARRHSDRGGVRMARSFCLHRSPRSAWLVFWRITGTGIDKTVKTEEHLPLTRIWTHPAFWAFMAAYGVAAMPLGFILYDSSLYLHARFNWSQSTLGYVLWIPPFGWEVGYFFWGFAV